MKTVRETGYRCNQQDGGCGFLYLGAGAKKMRDKCLKQSERIFRRFIEGKLKFKKNEYVTFKRYSNLPNPPEYIIVGISVHHPKGRNCARAKNLKKPVQHIAKYLIRQCFGAKRILTEVWSGELVLYNH